MVKITNRKNGTWGKTQEGDRVSCECLAQISEEERESVSTKEVTPLQDFAEDIHKPGIGQVPKKEGSSYKTVLLMQKVPFQSGNVLHMLLA